MNNYKAITQVWCDRVQEANE